MENMQDPISGSFPCVINEFAAYVHLTAIQTVNAFGSHAVARVWFIHGNNHPWTHLTKRASQWGREQAGGNEAGPPFQRPSVLACD